MADRSQHPGQIMETQTCYDLNGAIENWRDQLAAQPNLTAEVRRELETHLRDAIAGFQQRGLNDEESFWLACKRVGQPPQLGEEFVKVDPAAIWRERVFWMAFAFVLIDIWKTFTDDLFAFITNLFNKHYSIPIVHSMAIPLSYSCFTILSVLFVVWFSFYLAKGRTLQWRFYSGFIFQSRLRFLFVFLTLLFASYVFEAFNFWPNLQQASVSRAGIIQVILWNTCFHISLPLSLLTVCVWLIPTHSQKTPKHA
jgi:hypothetical protein